MLVIVKQMLLEGKMTFKDFVESEESIATNILSSKLKILEELGIVIKTKLPNNQKTNLYLLTEKGLSLTPILVELANWSDQNLREIHPTITEGEGMDFLRKDKVAFIQYVQDQYSTKIENVKNDQSI
jgi:DNA-binding HxlR family transcriptional regulator